jgi:lipopolysaccharide/colanic/teichoic acid biosynthesis glycosyltransferase
MVDIAPLALSKSQRVLKRALDVIGATTLLVISAPISICAAVAIKFTSRGPLIFKQLRSGYHEQPFSMYKFRTMHDEATDERHALSDANEADGPLFKMKEDPRVTRIGRFLRATSIDELPQLINVIKGDMSLVGPRPFIIEEARMIDGWAARRFEVRPGLTGLWQVSGRAELPYEELRRLDYAYVASWSIWWDLKILWQTPASVLRRWGAA